MKTKDFMNRKLTLEHEVRLNESPPRYCVWIGNYIVVSFEDACKLVAYRADDGSPVTSYRCYSPTSVTATENNEFAVAIPSSRKINIMKIHQNQLMCLRELIYASPDLIAYDKKNKHLLILSKSRMLIQKMSLHGKELGGKDNGCIDLINIDRKILHGTCNFYIDSLYGFIFVSLHHCQELICFDMSGIYIFHHTLEYPWSVITDSQGNAYVTSYKKNCIQLLRPNGLVVKSNLLGECRVKKLLAISLNKDMNKMAVTSDDSGGKLRLFKFE
jgi:hypothetical protein